MVKHAAKVPKGARPRDLNSYSFDCRTLPVLIIGIVFELQVLRCINFYLALSEVAMKNDCCKSGGSCRGSTINRYKSQRHLAAPKTGVLTKLLICHAFRVQHDLTQMPKQQKSFMSTGMIGKA